MILNGGLIPPGGLDNFGSGFLPASWQGSVFGLGNPPVSDILPREQSAAQQKRKLDLIRSARSRIRSSLQPRRPGRIRHPQLRAGRKDAARRPPAHGSRRRIPGDAGHVRPQRRISQYPHLRPRMPLARRLVERGVRFIELTCPAGNGDRWDQHSNLVDGHNKNARSVDKPISALLTDLKQRGLLKRTLVVWTGEFGRTPFAQGSDGRDHNPFGFSMWMAGGGIKGGTVYGATDDFGYKAIADKAEIHDLHATMLHLLGIDHTKLTYRFGGRDMRLTDVHGIVLRDVLA
ncbi:MAG UNVERIFIED_CONTAM: DUF1501 domain-containing protein [Planctomycetaceae bacterium]